MSVRPNSATFSFAHERITMDFKGAIQKKIVSIQNDIQSVQSFENFLDPNLPICVIACEGKVGTGKSTLMSLIALHLNNTIPANNLFEPANTTFSATPGCQVLNQKFIFNGVQIVLMDFEGQGGILDPSRNMDNSEYEQYLNKLMCLSFVIPSVLIVVSHQRIEADDLKKMKYLENIHKRMTNQRINLPQFKWFIKEGYKLKEQQLAQANITLQGNCPSILKNTNLVSIPYLDEDTLTFTKRSKYQVIEDLLLQVTVNPQNLPNKSKFLKIFNDTFSLINSNDFELAYGQRLEFYRVWEEWDQTERPKFDQAEKKLSLDCEIENDAGVLFEAGYQSLVQAIYKDINSRLMNKGITPYSVAVELDYEMKTKFDLSKAKSQYLEQKQRNQDAKKEREEHQQEIRQFNSQIQDNNNQIQKLQQDIANMHRRKKPWYKIF